MGTTNLETMEEKRRQFSTVLKNISPSNVISIDETCLYTKLTPTKRWTKKGTRTYLPVQRLESKRFSLITAMSNGHIVHSELLEGAVNEKLFRSFISNIPECGREYVLMDNVSFHKTKEVRSDIAKKGWKPVYTSPYSPEWNPTEMYFSYMKRRLRKCYHTRMDSLETFLQTLHETMESGLCNNWFNHVWKMVSVGKHRQ